MIGPSEKEDFKKPHANVLVTGTKKLLFQSGAADCFVEMLIL